MKEHNFKINRDAPIGIFDSGIGGLTVAKAVTANFPNESMIYFGDTAHLPYGEKSTEAIQEYTEAIGQFLLNKGCKILIIACNSASAAAYAFLKKRFGHQVPVIDAVTPLIEVVANRGFKKVGVIATKTTVRSDIYAQYLQALQPDLEVASLATSLLAPMIEEGFFDNVISKTVIKKYLSYPDFEGIEALLLACTHYPLIYKDIDAYFGGKVELFDSSMGVLKYLNDLGLTTNKMQKKHPKYEFWVSDYTNAFEQTTRFFYGRKIELKTLRWHRRRLVETIKQ